MVQLRWLTIVALILCSGVVGAVGASVRYEGKLTRVTEERATYFAIANNALAMSDRAFIFASGYQETLDICLSRMYATPTTVAVTTATKKGGLGGPDSLRGNGKLP